MIYLQVIIFGELPQIGDGDRLVLSQLTATSGGVNSGSVYTIKFDDTNFTNPTHVGTIGHSYSSSTYDLSINSLGNNDNFVAVSLTDDGSRLAVGAKKDDGANGGHSNSGAVYLLSLIHI